MWVGCDGHENVRPRKGTDVKTSAVPPHLGYLPESKTPSVMRRGGRSQPHSIGARQENCDALCLDNGGDSGTSYSTIRLSVIHRSRQNQSFHSTALRAIRRRSTDGAFTYPRSLSRLLVAYYSSSQPWQYSIVVTVYLKIVSLSIGCIYGSH